MKYIIVELNTVNTRILGGKWMEMEAVGWESEEEKVEEQTLLLLV